jgi:hypothetical protein
MGYGVVMRQTPNLDPHGIPDGTTQGYTYGDTLGGYPYGQNGDMLGGEPPPSPPDNSSFPVWTPRLLGWYTNGPFKTFVWKGGPAFQPNDVVRGITLGDVVYGYLNGVLELQIRDTTSPSGPYAGLNDFNCYNFNSGDHRMTSWSAGSVP